MFTTTLRLENRQLIEKNNDFKNFENMYCTTVSTIATIRNEINNLGIVSLRPFVITINIFDFISTDMIFTYNRLHLYTLAKSTEF